MVIKECDVLSVCDIPVKDQVTYLGAIITKDKTTRCQLNFNPIIEKNTN